MEWIAPPEVVHLSVTMPTPSAIALDPATTALVIVDMQEISRKKERVQRIIPGNRTLLEKARNAGVPVIFFRSLRTPDALEFVRYHKPMWRAEGTPETAIMAELTPKSGEFVLNKYSHDPFVDTALESLLKDQGVDAADWSIVVTGTSFAICAHACAMGFSTRQYLTVVPMDCVAANSLESEARAYHQFTGDAHNYNMRFTTSELISFLPGAERPEVQLPSEKVGWQ